MSSTTENTVKEEGNSVALKKQKVGKRGIAWSRIRRKILKHAWLVRLAIISLFFIVLYSGFILSSNIVRRTGMDVYFSLARTFIFTPADGIASSQGRTNILILGKGGEGHEAPDLTDTMIFASVSHDMRSTNLISLPRDIWITALRAKLNSVYYWGNKKEDGGGLVLAKASVEEIVGQPVHYVIVVDFSGFKKIIDVIGGIEVDIENTFTDEKYPIPGKEDDLCEGDTEFKCRYETVHFEKGLVHMNGDMALKFVRSRNAQGDEGTDFARAARQERVISAIKKKLLSREILLSPKKLIAFKDAVLASVETDIDAKAAAILARWIIRSKDNVRTQVFPEEFLLRPSYSDEYDNLYVFVPKSGSWQEVHVWVSCLLDGTVCD